MTVPLCRFRILLLTLLADLDSELVPPTRTRTDELESVSCTADCTSPPRLWAANTTRQRQPRATYPPPVPESPVEETWDIVDGKDFSNEEPKKLGGFADPDERTSTEKSCGESWSNGKSYDIQRKRAREQLKTNREMAKKHRSNEGREGAQVSSSWLPWRR